MLFCNMQFYFPANIYLFKVNSKKLNKNAYEHIMETRKLIFLVIIISFPYNSFANLAKRAC